MKRNHSGYHRITIYRRIKRQMKAYYEATEEPEPEVPSTSTAVGNQSPEPEMPILNSETSADAIRLNPIFGDCGHEMVRKTVIDWFHGSRDRYGGRAKRQKAIGGTSDDTRCPTLPPSEETEPAVDAGTSGTPN
nr:unnamed protein product [Spirometra erinaceieuropaei]